MSTPAITTEYDITGLNYTLGELLGVLDVDKKTVLRAEAGQWAGQIAAQLGPRTEATGKKSVKASFKRNYFPLKPRVDFYQGSRAGKGDIQWLFSTNKKIIALVGADPENIKLGMSASALRKLPFKPTTKRAWEDLGTVTGFEKDKKGRLRPVTTKFNGSQRAYRLNRLIVDWSAYQSMMTRAIASIGKLRATFAYTASKLLGTQQPPFITRHFPGMVNGRAIFDESKLNHPTNPSITFGSRAKGVISNNRIADVIESSAKKRAEVISAKVKKILSGYAYDLKTGATFKPRAGQDYGSNIVMPL
jgi:hypothetical protein